MLQINLQGHTSIVTGATGQIGRVLVRKLAETGSDVIIHYLHNSEKAAELVKLVQELGVHGFAVQADVGSMDQISAMKAVIASDFQLPDIVVTNAVTDVNPWLPVLEQPEEDFFSQFYSSVMHNINMAKAFVPEMIKHSYGRVIGISTEAAVHCNPRSSAYASGKKGMDAILRVLAKEVGRYGITVNQIAPGWTISDRDRENHTEVQLTDQRIPLRRRGTDEEVANAVAFLASDLASYITGSYIPVSGGTISVGL